MQLSPLNVNDVLYKKQKQKQKKKKKKREKEEKKKTLNKLKNIKK